MRPGGPAPDAVLVVSFGGPEGPQDVMPFLDRVLAGRGVPESRKREVAGHYQLFGGVSPLNAANRDLVERLRAELAAHGLGLPVYWGNRHWHPLLGDTIRTMAGDGVRAALGFVTSAYASYSGCRQYLEALALARAEVGPAAPLIDKLRGFHDHPGFVEANAARIREAFQAVPEPRRAQARLVLTAHSIPSAMAAGCDYVTELRETAALVADRVPHAAWDLAYQSRSGSPAVPWLEPDVGDHLEALARAGIGDVVVAPIGFVSDHMETVYDLDVLLAARARELGLAMVRAGTAGTHPAFVSMIRELIQERLDPGLPRRALGTRGPRPDRCPPECCPSGRPAAG